MWLGFPSNPTAAVAELPLFEEAVGFAGENDLLLAHDAAYSEMTFDGFVAPSVLQVPGARDVAVELGSASKTFNMTGWRIGWAVGNAEAIRALATVKTNIDSGVFEAVQRTLNDLGWDLEPPLGSFYVWLPTRDGASSAEFCDFLLEQAAVVAAPGAGYGPQGEGWVRFSLTVPDDRLEEAVARLRKALE
jgi:LL-diaminopimelate aminotransferase